MTVVTPDIFRATIQKYVGCKYGFCDRCGGGCHPCQYDCSGLMCKGTNETGLTRNVCTSSFVIAQQCYDLGLLVSFEEADHLDGVWFIRGDDLGRRDNGSKANGASGHIVYRVRWVNPDTEVITWYTIEAMGKRYGVVNGSTDGRMWDAAYKIPGMSYDAPPPPLPAQELEDMLISAPKWQQTSPNRTPTVGLDLAKNSLVRRNGPRFVDSAGKPAGDAIPVGANKAVGMFETFENGEKEGFTVQTSADASGNADFHYVWVKKPGG